MSIQTTLSIDANAVIELSRSKQEPEWMTALRTEGLALANFGITYTRKDEN